MAPHSRASLPRVVSVVTCVVIAMCAAHGAHVDARTLSPRVSDDRAASCGDAAQCTYTYHSPATNKSYTYELASLCSDMDYELQDPWGHTYFANICGHTQHACYPGECRRKDTRVVA